MPIYFLGLYDSPYFLRSVLKKVQSNVSIELVTLFCEVSLLKQNLTETKFTSGFFHMLFYVIVFDLPTDCYSSISLNKT